MNILVIEDSNLERELILRLLKQENLNVLSAANGKKGIELAEEVDANFDVILLDIIMPGIDGYETCRLLKSSLKTENIPVIFITGNTDIESLKKSFEVGGADFISKPVNKYNLLARVKVHAENNRLIKDFKEANDQYTSQNEELMQIIDQLDEAKNLLEEKDKKIRDFLLNL